MKSFAEAAEIFKKAIARYGETWQVLKASEECSELAQALNKYVIYKATNNIEGKKESELIDNIFEEMADVYIMLNQLQLILGNTNMAFENWLEKKLERLEERCAENKKEEGKQ